MSNHQLRSIAYSLVDTAVHGIVERIMEDLQLLEELFASNPSILKDLSETSVSVETRCAAFEKAVGNSLHPYVVHAAQMLITKNALAEFASFKEAVTDIAEKKGVYRQIEVISAEALDQEQIGTIKKTLGTKLGGTVSIKPQIQPAILGGIICRGKEWTIDASIRNRIQSLQKNLASS